jgi:hypothetical protein
MSYEQFVQKVDEEIKAKLGGKRKTYIYTATKNNGMTRTGITFVEEGVNVSPTIYLEEFFEKYLCGFEMEFLVEQILGLYENVRIREPWECAYIDCYEVVKDRIVFRLVNKEANKNLLKDTPHISFLNLAIIFHVLVELDETGEHMATMLIKNEHMESWNVTVEDLYGIAVRNTEEILPSEMSSMRMLMEEYFSESERDEVNPGEDYMYVLTNNRRNFGASAILYPDRLKVIGMFLKENFYILPSSIHEVIIVPESKTIAKDELNQIVCEINHSQVPEEEILSDTVYYYDRTKEELYM